MNSFAFAVRTKTKAFLDAAGLLPAARRVAALIAAPPAYRRYERRVRQLRREHAEILREPLSCGAQERRIALVCSPSFPEAHIQLGLVKALQLANFVPVVMLTDTGRDGRLLAELYRLAGIDEIHELAEFCPAANNALAEEVIGHCKSMWDLLEFERAGIRVGRLAVSSALRSTYRGSLDLQSPKDRKFLLGSLAYSIACADAAQQIVRKFQPAVAMFVDTVYCPTGELFDCCIQAKVDVIQWQQSHKSNTLLFKRYSPKNLWDHPSSLSEQSWRVVREMDWSDSHRQELDRDLYSTYASGDWYSVAGTQFDTSIVESKQILRDRLQLDPSKKTAFIFPHILWDATLFWGECLFRNFEEWFIATVREACANDRVNWVIKIHPANRRLREAWSLRSEPAEVVALKKYIGKLPAHIHMVPPESEISTYSLFAIMDYCLTVCGTVGVEAARLGVPVVTGGRGYYDNRGFTVDSKTREEYLEKLRTIQRIPPLSPSQRELAERFAYVNFLMRPWRARSVTLRYLPHSKKFLSQAEVNIRAKDDWRAAEDIRALAEWLQDPAKPEEYLSKLSQACSLTR